MQVNSIIGSLLAIRPGQSVIYFTGFLDLERGGTAMKAPVLARQLASRGRVYLTQRRLGPPTIEGAVDWQRGIGPGFEYIATGAIGKPNDQR